MQNNHALLRASGRRRPRRRGQRRLFFSLLCEQKKKPTANLQKSQKPKKNALGKKKKTAARSPAGKTKGAFRSHPPRRIARYKAKMTLFHSRQAAINKRCIPSHALGGAAAAGAGAGGACCCCCLIISLRVPDRRLANQALDGERERGRGRLASGPRAWAAPEQASRPVRPSHAAARVPSDTGGTGVEAGARRQAGGGPREGGRPTR